MDQRVDQQSKEEGWDIKELWTKYEEITMHFNDLLMRLRTQALAGVAALSTLAGLFTNTDVVNMRANWEIAMFMFGGLSLFWVAIWILDFTYYNKLLLGAVTAIKALETESLSKGRTNSIQISTILEAVVAGQKPDGQRKGVERFWSQIGRWSFYSIVFVVTAFGFFFSLYMYLFTSTTPP